MTSLFEQSIADYYQLVCGILMMVGPKMQDFCVKVTRISINFFNGGAWGLRS